MSYSSSSSTGMSGSASTNGFFGSNGFFGQEKTVFKTNIGLVLSTAVITAVYSYFGIDMNVNNAINRSLLMALSTFISASAVNMLENNGYLVYGSNNARYIEGALIPVLYYGITKRQFALPDVNSQAIKTGVIAAVVGELANTTVSKYIDKYEMTPTDPDSPTSKVATPASVSK